MISVITFYLRRRGDGLGVGLGLVGFGGRPILGGLGGLTPGGLNPGGLGGLTPGGLTPGGLGGLTPGGLTPGGLGLRSP